MLKPSKILKEIDEETREYSNRIKKVKELSSDATV